MARTRTTRLTGTVSLSIDFDPEKPPVEFRIFRAGENPSEKGVFVFDDDSAACVMNEYARHNKPMLLDYNHGTMAEEAAPEVGISAGEFIPEVRSGELWATNIRWTERAAALIKAREYRCFSPLFNAKEGRVVRLINVALTNLPALDGIAPLMAASAHRQEDDMEPKEQIEKLTAQVAELTAKLAAKDGEAETVKLTAAVGLKSSASKEEVHAAVAGLVALRTKIREVTGKDSDATALGVIDAWKSEAIETAALKAKVVEIETAALKADLANILDQAGKDGKIAPAERVDWEGDVLLWGGGRLTKESVERLRARVEKMTAKVATAGAAATQAAATPSLDSESTRISATLGVKRDDYLKFRTERASRA